MQYIYLIVAYFKNMPSTVDIYDLIANKPDKEILFTEDFREFGSSEAIKSAMHRFVKRGVLKRLAKGIYVKPGYSDLLKMETMPPLEALAQAIAKRDHARIAPTGAMAMYKLGLTTQIPLKVAYLTDGSARKINIGKTEITFKRVTPKKLVFKGELSSLAIQALSEIGRTNLDQDLEKRVITQLKKEKYEDLKHDIRLAPQWIAEIMAKAL